MKFFTVICTCIVILYSCSRKEFKVVIIDGIKCYQNISSPSNHSDEVIAPKLLYEIKGSTESSLGHPFALVVDKNDNLFILDVEKCLISIFDKNGSYKKSFGGSGTGPGESIFPNNIAIVKDTVIVSSMSNKLLNKYSLNGEFLYSSKINGPVPIYVKSITDSDNLIGFTEFVQKEKNGLSISVALALMDNQFNELKNIREQKVIFDSKKPVNFLDLYPPYALGMDKIYVSKNKDASYAIDIFNTKGVLIERITKSYATLPLSEEEKKEFNESLKRINGGNNPPISATFKKPINNIYIDKYNRLLVVVSVDRRKNKSKDCFLDIFKNGKFENRVKLEIIPGNDFIDFENQLFFYGERIYYLDMMSSSVKVYDY